MKIGFIPKDERDKRFFLPVFKEKNIDLSLMNRNGFWIEYGNTLKAGYFERSEDFSEFIKTKNKIKIIDKNILDLDLIFMRAYNPPYAEYPYSKEYLDFLFDVCKIMELEGYPVINPVNSIYIARKKYLTYYLLQKEGIKIPLTFSTHDPVRAFFSLKDIGFPIVFKPADGAGGVGIVITDDKSTAGDLTSLYGGYYKVPILQKYIENPGRDIRVLVIGTEVIGAIYRIQNKGIKKSGISSGGTPKEFKPDAELEELAIKCSQIIGCKIAGVDVIEYKEDYIVLEINASPAFEGFMQATNKNIPEIIVHYLMDEAKC
ncbi:MAG: RimK family alpha-L-glutamate ligase [Methanosarcinales archaeon]